MDSSYYIGRRYGHWLVTDYHHTNCTGHKFFECLCDCGTKKIVRLSKLISGESKSCGCKRRELYENGAYTEGHRTKLYNTWLGMRERCCNNSNINYKNYGGKGISVCDEWSLFETFRSWAYANGYKEGLTIDRKDINKGYYPENCQWADYITQANNTSRNVFVTYNGNRMTIAEWARTIGVNYRTLYNVLMVDKRMGKIRKFFPDASSDNFLISKKL